MTSLLTLQEAQARVLSRARSLPAETVPVAEAAGRVVAEDARALVDLPPFASSAMDGFAVRTADLPGVLHISGESAAGRPHGAGLRPGEAVTISTGAVVPAGADAIIPLEHVVRTDDSVSIESRVDPGTNIRPQGGDVRSGEIVVARGEWLGPSRVAALAATGLAAVSCVQRPRVAVVATGSELVATGDPLRPGQIYEANSILLGAMLEATGAEVISATSAIDDERALRTAIERGLRADVLVTSGGVSVGEHDLVRVVERELGVEEVFWRVAVKPGKPISFGVHDRTLVFGLPGNPVSALVGCELFVKPAVRALQGAAAPLPRLEPGRLARGLVRTDDRDEFVRARSRIEGDAVVLEPIVGQDSHMIVRSGAADALVHVPRGKGELRAGSAVSWLRLTA